MCIRFLWSILSYLNWNIWHFNANCFFKKYHTTHFDNFHRHILFKWPTNIQSHSKQYNINSSYQTFRTQQRAEYMYKSSIIIHRVHVCLSLPVAQHWGNGWLIHTKHHWSKGTKSNKTFHVAPANKAHQNRVYISLCQVINPSDIQNCVVQQPSVQQPAGSRLGTPTPPGPLFIQKTPSYWYRDSHYL